MGQLQKLFYYSIDTIKTINYHKTIKNRESIFFKLTNFKAWKATNLKFKSDSFYTSCNGYHMRISVAANGYDNGKGTHVSVSTGLIEGRYDSQLHWPFLGTVTYELLNQLRDDSHYTRIYTYTARHGLKAGKYKAHEKFLCHSFLSHNPATRTQYLLDDTLYFKVPVTVTDHKPWLDCTHHS